MKAEINIENKARFFALYWGQKVVELVGYEDLVNPYVAHLNNDGRRPKLNSKIILKPLSSISDEDIKNVCIIEGHRHEQITFGQVLRSESKIELELIDNEYPNDFPARLRIYLSNRFLIEWDNMQSFEDNQTIGASPSSYDYLRAKGYALPWMGLSVDEMVEAGWIKLVE